MLDIIQAPPVQNGAPKPEGTNAASGSPDMFGSLVAPLTKDSSGEPEADLTDGEASPEALLASAAKADEGKATFIAGLVALDDVVLPEEPSPDAAVLGEATAGALDMLPELTAGTPAQPAEETADGEAVPVEEAEAAPLDPSLALAAAGKSAEAAARSGTIEQAKVPGTPGAVPGAGANKPAATMPSAATDPNGGGDAAPDLPATKLPEPALANAGQKAAPQGHPAIATAQTAAGDAATQAAAATQAPVRPQTSLRASAETSATTTSVDGADGAEGADTVASVERTVTKPATTATVLDRPVSPGEALQAKMVAAEQAFANAERTLSEMQSRGEQRFEQMERQLTQAATGRSGVDHIALGRMYAPPGATPISDFAMQVSRRIAGGATKFDIRLDPPELGRVDVSLEMKGDRAVVRLVVERAETLDFLARDARTLEKALQEAGVNVDAGQMEFSLGQEGQSETAGDGRGPRYDDPRAEDETDLASLQTAGRTIRADALLDLMI